MKYLLVILVTLFLLARVAMPAHAQTGTPPTPPPQQPPITQGDVTALQQQANAAQSDVSAAGAGLAQAQAQYNAATNRAAQARAAAVQAEQQLKAQQTAEGLDAAHKAEAIADQADRDLAAIAVTLQAAQGQMQSAQQHLDTLSAALTQAHADLAQRDQTIASQAVTIAEQGATITQQNLRLIAAQQYQDLINTLIVLIGFEVVISAIVALFIARWYRQSKRVVLQAVANVDQPSPIRDSEAMAQHLDRLVTP